MRLLSILAPPLCVACRGPAPGVLCRRCGACLEYQGPVPIRACGLAAWAPLAYEGPARAVVGRLKFSGAVSLADHMAAAIAANAPGGFLDAPLVPVPSPRARHRRRGYCHAALIARALARRTGLAVICALEREGDRRQVGRARAERLRTPPRFRPRGTGSGAVILVDDVVTTGATLGACAAALERAGWRCDRAVAYARTPVR